MTRFSEGYGGEFDGNTILLNIGAGMYVHVGGRVILFKAQSPIVEFHSPVGNNDVPYPYAVDRDRRCYLLIENTVISLPENFALPAQDPYRYFYDRGLMTPDVAIRPPKRPQIASGISEFYYGSDQFTMTWDGDASNYDAWVGKGVRTCAIVENGVRRDLSRNEYLAIMKGFADLAGFAPLGATRLA